ncbi:MAG: hypothetical protein LUP97_02100 [Methanoregula sp.]|nr:hypothetical protein [Methanoregula sp.]
MSQPVLQPRARPRRHEDGALAGIALKGRGQPVANRLPVRQTPLVRQATPGSDEHRHRVKEDIPGSPHAERSIEQWIRGGRGWQSISAGAWFPG